MKAWELLSDPKKWTQGTYATTAKGMNAMANSKNAIKWCTVGALQKCYGEKWLEVEMKFHKKTKVNTVAWNDAPERTHSEVLAALKAADV